MKAQLRETRLTITLDASKDCLSHLSFSSVVSLQNRKIARWIMGVLILLILVGYGALSFYFSNKMIHKRVMDRVKSKVNSIPSAHYAPSMRESSCAICLEDFCEGETVSLLPCGHIFHCRCIVPWFGEQKSECPVCKTPSYRGKDLVILSDLDDM